MPYQKVSIPFEQGDVFRLIIIIRRFIMSIKSQSLSSRAMSFDTFQSTSKSRDWALNPFRAGRCLSTRKEKLRWTQRNTQSLSSRAMSFDTAVVCWRQESCGLSDPLPNFWGRLRSWLLIWANNKQFAYFSFLNQSKVRSILPLFFYFF